MLDLNQVYNVGTVAIYNRVDSSQHRIDGAVVRLQLTFTYLLQNNIIQTEKKEFGR